MTRFGLPTMPAELTIYSLSFIDRIIIVRLAGLAEAGLYALAVKFANGMQVLARGFHLAWPPLAYSIQDDDEARRAYSLIITWFVALVAFAVVGLWLLAPWLVRVLADERFFAANEAVGPLAAGTALYAVYLALVVILGRTGRTELSFPATLAAVAVNIALNLVLVPEHGIVGAGVALMGSYVVVLVIMWAIVRRLFFVPYEWRRLALAVGLAAVLIALGETLVPHDGLDGFALTLALCAAYPAGLWAGALPERRGARTARSSIRASAKRPGPRRERAGGPGGVGRGPGDAGTRTGAGPRAGERPTPGPSGIATRRRSSRSPSARRSGGLRRAWRRGRRRGRIGGARRRLRPARPPCRALVPVRG